MVSFRDLGALGVLFACVGCNAFDAPLPESSGNRLVIPTDTRAPLSAATKPPAVSGGTLIVQRSGLFAVASDPERDSLVIADLAAGTVARIVPLEKGDEPGRLVEDALGRVHVALRRGGAVVTVDPASGQILDRRAVCGAPRGIALSGADSLEVACADGKLVSLPTGAGGVTRSVPLEPDLRDVFVRNGETTVTRFKSAELLRLDATGAVSRRERPTSVLGFRTVSVRSGSSDDSDLGLRQVERPFRPLVAWRTLAGPNGSTVIVHQRAVDAPIEITEPTEMGSSYGGSDMFGCSGISQNAVTVMGAQGATLDMTFQGAPLPVDATLLPDGVTLLVAHAGPRDPSAPRPFVVFEGDDAPRSGGDFGDAGFGISTLSIVALPPPPAGPAAAEGTVAPNPNCTPATQVQITNPAVAVAYNPLRPTQVVVQTRQPSTLVVIDDINQFWAFRTIAFDDGQTLDTGFQLFHRDSGGGIACATCHAEGAEDGNVWRFEGMGERRTQSLNVGLDGTEPFHWDGTLYSVGMLMNEVFVGRMGGIHESPARLGGLEDWLFSQKPLPALRASNDAAVLRGKEVFESPRVGCASCHSGAEFTNNESRFVGTDARVLMQVPSLVGVGYRAPFMHDGCAPTLAARFDPACGGGEEHGHTKDLTQEQLGDLVAYLESL
jgi:mono/diheme cytochrome c family protein